jgi:hypothetical protein
MSHRSDLPYRAVCQVAALPMPVVQQEIHQESSDSVTI